jgi:AcrR family transcriptional regulator
MAHPLLTDLRERLFQVALAHVRRRGYAQASVSDMTREVGVAKGTFFNYFPTKGHILSEVLHRWVEESVGEVDARLTGAEAVLGFGRSLASRMGADRKVAEAVVFRLSELPGVQVADMGGAVRAEDRVRDWIEARLTEALPVAVPLVEVRPALLAFVLTCVFRGTLDEWLRGRQETRALDVAVAGRMSYVLRAWGLPANP